MSKEKPKPKEKPKVNKPAPTVPEQQKVPEPTPAEERELKAFLSLTKPKFEQLERIEQLQAKAEAAAAVKKAAEIKRRMALTPIERRKEDLENNLKSISAQLRRPMETITNYRLELRAIENGHWKPGWKPPRRKTAIDKFLDS